MSIKYLASMYLILFNLLKIIYKPQQHSCTTLLNFTGLYRNPLLIIWGISPKSPNTFIAMLKGLDYIPIPSRHKSNKS